MYHYVREIKKSKYSNLKGLEFNNFKKQINFFIKNFNILTNDDFIEIIKTKKIPKRVTSQMECCVDASLSI